MASTPTLKFEPERIINEGYMVKSPPMGEDTIIKKRWCMRWFVLCYVGGKPILFYFQNEKCRKQEKPKGHISLDGAELYKQRSRLHGYPYVINIQTNYRLYHLCTTQLNVHEDWLEKLRDHYIPTAELTRQPRPSSSCHLSSRLEQPRPSLSADEILNDWQRTTSNASNVSNVTSNSDEYECPYSHKPSYFTYNPVYVQHTSMDDSSHAQRNETWPTDNYTSPDKSSTLPIPRIYTQHINSNRLPLTAENILHQSADRTFVPPSRLSTDSYRLYGDEETAMSESYVTMGEAKKDVKKIPNIDSEDEGIGRSDSDSSGTSTVSNCAPMTDLLRAALRSSICENEGSLLGAGFVGPKLTSTNKSGSKMKRTRSMGDLL